MATREASGKTGPNLEVLVATMGQKNLSIAERMHLTKSAIIANQCERWDYEEEQSDFGRIAMISTKTKGVGINRNLALQLSTADFLLFADDDIVYYDGALDGVENAFRELPDADVIFFGIDMTKEGKVFDARRNKVKRVRPWNSLRYGACRMAVRRNAIIENRISFSTLFGGGCIYCSGEDTIFICDCLKAGLKLYSHSCVLGACAKDSSTWFSGFNDKYFYDRGAMLACAFPHLKHFIKWYFVYKLMRKANVSPWRIVREMNAGICGFRTLTPYHKEGDIHIEE